MTPGQMPSGQMAEDTVERIRQMQEQMLEQAKSAGTAALDAYEKTLKSMLDFEQRVGQASQLEWVSALASAHARFIEDMTSAYTSAARQMLK